MGDPEDAGPFDGIHPPDDGNTKYIGNPVSADPQPSTHNSDPDPDSDLDSDRRDNHELIHGYLGRVGRIQ